MCDLPQVQQELVDLRVRLEPAVKFEALSGICAYPALVHAFNQSIHCISKQGKARAARIGVTVTGDPSQK